MEPGQRIEHYVLIEQIGQGGQAIVWSADDERLKRVVAVKAISLHPDEVKGESSQTAGDPVEIARRFQDEAQIIAALEHPSILPVYTYGQEGDALYIVMRYMAGGSLKRLLQNGPMEPAQVVKSARSLADALDLAHQRKIVHRDIKSANVLLDARNNLYLADFGLSITLGENTQAGGGTLAYMSPEQMSGDPLDHLSDLYAFGILIYEMLTGVVPRSGDHPWNYMQVLSNAPLPIPDMMSPEIADVLRKITALQPQDRYRSAGEVIDALSEAINQGAPAPVSGDSLLMPISYDTSYLPPTTDPATIALLTANSMFDAALADWADGAGRFRFYEDDFQYVASFYNDPEAWSLQLDKAAYRLLLRASLEYGHDVDSWWAALADVAEQRGIALQTLNSERAPARMRAMQRLATIADSEPPAIPTRVAAILSREPDKAVRAAGINLLEQQAKPAAEWRPVAFNETIDGTLAEIAGHDPDPKIAQSAAHVCGRLRSTFAVNKLGDWAVAGEDRALQALTYVRENAPNLPSSVPASIRQRVFVLLSLRQVLVLSLIWRFLGAAIGFIIGWGGIQYLQYTGRDLLGLQAVGNAAASGILYSLLVALSVVFAAEPARRLQAWTKPARIILAWVLGAGLCAIAFLTIRRYYYFNNDPPDLPWIIISSVIFAAGFAIASGLTGRTWIRSAAGAAGVLFGLYFSWTTYASGQAQDPLIYFQPPEQALALIVFFAAALALCAFLPEASGLFRPFLMRIRNEEP